MRQTPSPDYRNLSPNETASQTERHSSVDGCALLRLRFDRKYSLVQSQPLFHADQAEPPAPLCGFAVKTCAAVTHREMNLIRRTHKPTSMCRAPLCFTSSRRASCRTGGCGPGSAIYWKIEISKHMGLSSFVPSVTWLSKITETEAKT